MTQLRWSQSGSQGNRWRRGEIFLGFQSHFQVCSDYFSLSTLIQWSLEMCLLINWEKYNRHILSKSNTTQQHALRTNSSFPTKVLGPLSVHIHEDWMKMIKKYYGIIKLFTQSNYYLLDSGVCYCWEQFIGAIFLHFFQISGFSTFPICI